MAGSGKKTTREPRKAEVAAPGSERSRDALMDAAKRLFSQKGFDGTTVKDIADAAGVNVSLISYYFQGKEGLYRVCLEQFAQSRLLAAQRLLTHATSAEEFKIRLKMFYEEMIGCYLDEPDLHRIVHRECDMAIPGVEEVYRQSFLKIYETLVSFVQSAQDRGIIRKNLESRIGASLMFGSLMSLIRTDSIGKKLLGISLEDASYRELVLNQIVPVFFHGMGNTNEEKAMEKSHEE